MPLLQRLLVVLLAFSCALSEASRIQIQYDTRLRRRPGDNFVDYLGRIRIQNRNGISNRTLVRLALDAHQEMQNVITSQHRRGRPQAMTALVLGRDVWFGSSILAAGSENRVPMLPDIPVLQGLLRQCQSRSGGEHTNGERCGELNVLSVFLREHNNRFPRRRRRIRIITVNARRPMRPCNGEGSSNSAFGCEDLLASAHLAVVPDGTVPEDEARLPTFDNVPFEAPDDPDDNPHDDLHK